MRRICLVGMCMLLSCMPSRAQKYSISTDLLGYACLGTFNAEMSMAVSRKWSLTAGMRYNPFTFNSGSQENQFQMRQQSYSLGVRLWPWHTASGWWMACKMRYQEYNMGGLFSDMTEEGDRYGAGLYAGYTHMLSPHFNLEVGLGVWGGFADYRRYSCPLCGFLEKMGHSFFLLPDDLMISVAYVF